MTVPALTDDTVVLDAFTDADVDAHLAGEDEELARRFGWHPDRSSPTSVAATIQRWRREWADGGATRAFAVRRIDDGSLIGGVELRLGPERVAELSYWIFPAARGEGYAGRAIRLVSEFAFGTLEVERVEAFIEPDNIGSLGAAQRIGFVPEGLLRGRGLFGDERRDMVILGLLSTDLRD